MRAADEVPPPSCRSFCWRHRLVQRVRAMQRDQTLCLICRDEVAGRPCYTTMVCPSCASAWFHRRCIQGQALRSGLHHFRCPLCRDMTAFQAEMFRLGIKIPDRDAAWEEEGSLLDLVLWQSSCDADQCLCPLGRDQAEQAGPWRLLVCSSCGSRGTHQCCSALEDATESWECRDCSGTHSGEGGSGGTGCPGRGGSHSHWGLGDRRCDAWREGAWQGLVVLIISLPPAVPDIAAGPDSCPLAQGPWHSAPSKITGTGCPEAVEPPPLQTCQHHLDTILCSLLQEDLLLPGVGLDDLQRSPPALTMVWFCDPWHFG
ncbi:PHD finger protein 7-like [Falco biarmicus]|uniref:PHD finger protein 7-like n=1 Tax=Falco biarmicus TaxID=345155 RepID=UPI0024BC38E4|nr:PHD finger protein 7-like [Falco biarmicus]